MKKEAKPISGPSLKDTYKIKRMAITEYRNIEFSVFWGFFSSTNIVISVRQVSGVKAA